MVGLFGAIWGFAGTASLLGFAIFRLAPVAFDADALRYRGPDPTRCFELFSSDELKEILVDRAHRWGIFGDQRTEPEG